VDLFGLSSGIADSRSASASAMSSRTISSYVDFFIILLLHSIKMQRVLYKFFLSSVGSKGPAVFFIIHHKNSLTMAHRDRAYLVRTSPPISSSFAGRKTFKLCSFAYFAMHNVDKPAS